MTRPCAKKFSDRKVKTYVWDRNGWKLIGSTVEELIVTFNEEGADIKIKRSKSEKVGEWSEIFYLVFRKPPYSSSELVDIFKEMRKP